jgi:hypothetical protein
MQLSHRNYTKRSAHFNGAFQRVRIENLEWRSADAKQ